MLPTIALSFVEKSSPPSHNRAARLCRMRRDALTRDGTHDKDIRTYPLAIQRPILDDAQVVKSLMDPPDS